MLEEIKEILGGVLIVAIHLAVLILMVYLFAMMPFYF